MPRLLWDQLPDETNGEFQKFRIFLALPRANRNIKQAWEAFLAQGGGDDTARSRGHRPNGTTRARRMSLAAPGRQGSAPGAWYDLADKQRWDERARAFDAHEDRIIEKSLRDRRLQTLVETADVGRELRKRGSEALALLRATTETIEVQEDGSQVTIRSATLTPDEIVRLIKVGAELEAVALGMPGGRIAVVSPEDDQAQRALENAHEELVKRLEDIRARQNQAQALLDAGPELPNVPAPSGGDGSIQPEVMNLPAERLGDPKTFGPSEDEIRRRRRSKANPPDVPPTRDVHGPTRMGPVKSRRIGGR